MGDPFGFFNIFVAKHQKIEGGPFEVIKIFSKKISQCRKKTGRMDPLESINIHSITKHQEN